MLRFIIIAACITLGFSQDSKIAGGYDAKITDHPYQVSLQLDGGHFCGGAIISSKWVVTAAHCTNFSMGANVNVRYGIDNLNNAGEVVAIARVHQHPKFNRELDYDISVLELASDIAFGPNAQPIDLPEKESDPNGGIVVTMTGWGVTASGWRSDILQEIQMHLNSREECRGRYGDQAFTDRMICAGDGTSEACEGDSGGPLVADGKLLGVFSWNVGCPYPGFPGAYANVGALREYITEISSL